MIQKKLIFFVIIALISNKNLSCMNFETFGKLTAFAAGIYATNHITNTYFSERSTITPAGLTVQKLGYLGCLYGLGTCTDYKILSDAAIIMTPAVFIKNPAKIMAKKTSFINLSVANDFAISGITAATAFYVLRRDNIFHR